MQNFQQNSFSLIFIVLSYLLTAYPLYVIAQKTNQELPWLAFIPIVQIVPLVKAAGRELWWIVLLFIPCVNIVIAIMLWMDVAKNLGKPSWLGLLMIVPIANFIIPWYLALG